MSHLLQSCGANILFPPTHFVQYLQRFCHHLCRFQVDFYRKIIHQTKPKSQGIIAFQSCRENKKRKNFAFKPMRSSDVIYGGSKLSSNYFCFIFKSLLGDDSMAKIEKSIERSVRFFLLFLIKKR